MVTIKFKTNINCSSCVATVTPYIEKIESIKNWEVDTSDKNKILEVNAAQDVTDEVLQSVEKAGYNIEKIGNGFFSKFL